jgi:calcineurin-like phosphoesterase family protein
MMNKGLEDRWNEVVGENDIVFILGDVFWYKDPQQMTNKLKRLNGSQIYILPGNHDDVPALQKIKDNRVHIISDITVVFISGLDEDKPTRAHEFMLSHFPLATWSHFSRGVLNLHGHIHSGPRSRNEIDVPGYDLILKPHLTYDVGVDNNNYTPIEIREIINKMKNNENL